MRKLNKFVIVPVVEIGTRRITYFKYRRTKSLRNFRKC